MLKYKTVKIDSELHQKLKLKAIEEQITLRQLVRRYIEATIDKNYIKENPIKVLKKNPQDKLNQLTRPVANALNKPRGVMESGDYV